MIKHLNNNKLTVINLINNITLITIVPKLIKALLLSSYKQQVYDYATIIKLNRSSVYNIAIFISKHCDTKFNFLSDLVCYDIPGKVYRFAITYHLLSLVKNERMRIITHTNEVLSVPTLTKLFAAASAAEREAWDCYGIFFRDHPDLRRILSDYGFQGHPFRKDFPIIGFFEIQYHEIIKSIQYEPVEQTAEYRNFK
jgi:NADH:ubiquinone oxidoreductase subunit C